jgi:hypothetical protein
VRGCLLALLLLAAQLPAADRHAGEFLRIDTGAAAVGRGNAGLLQASPGTAAWWNPALIPDSSERHLALQHQTLFDGELKQEFIGWEGRWREMPLGVYLIRQSIENIPILDALEGGDSFEAGGRPVPGFESAQDWMLGLGSSFDLGERFRAGLTVKLVHRDLVAFTGQGIGLDAGLTSSPLPGLDLALRLRDLTGTIVIWDDGEQDWIAPEAALGAAWQTPLSRLRSRLMVEVDLVTELEGKSPGRDGNWRSVSAQGGLEWILLERFRLRAGWSEGDPAAGAGMSLGRLGVDYAWRPHEDLGASHLVMLSVRLP